MGQIKSQIEVTTSDYDREAAGRLAAGGMAWLSSRLALPPMWR